MKLTRLFALLVLTTAIPAAPLLAQVGASDTPAVTISDRNPLDGPFLGFGAEWDTMAYRHFKITDDDFSLIRSRLAWMKMPVVRAMMLSNWCYLGGDQYDFDSPSMQMLYRQLDLCQELGIKVFLTDWGLNDTWMKAPGLTGVADPKYAEVIGAYLDHLINVKQYSCIQQFIFMNEPEWMGYNKVLAMTPEQARDTWIQGLKNVRAVLGKRGLLQKLSIAGPDQSGNQYDWLQHIVRTAPGDLDTYDIHLYANQRRQYPTTRQAADSGLIRNYLREVWGDVRKNDPDKTKPLILGEAGFAVWPPEVPKEAQFSGASNALGQDWAYGLYMTQYAIQAVEAGTWSVLAWMLDDSSHYNFTWGMWSNKNEGAKLKPWFYTWALLTRAFPADSKFFLLNSLPPQVEGLSARIPLGKEGQVTGWSFVFANTSDAPVALRLTLPNDSSTALSRYVYAANDARTDSSGFPAPVETINAQPGTVVSVDLPARSVTFITPASLSEFTWSPDALAYMYPTSYSTESRSHSSQP